MNIEIIKTMAIRSFSRGALQLKKYAPEILTGVGIVGGVTSAVMAAKASINLNDELQEARTLVSLRKENRAELTEAEYDTRTYQRDISVAYYLYAKQLGKIYGPALAIGTASIVCILSAHGILQHRNTSVMAAYGALDAAYKAYRKRVEEELGAEKEMDLFKGVKELVETSEDENGKKSKKKSVSVDPDAGSPYRVLFDEYNPEWSKDPEHNLTFLQVQQRYANDLLRSRGHLFLNQVYELLRMPDTSQGAIVGWIYEGDGDSYVDFGMYDMNDSKSRDFVIGQERSIWLDFNVDGVIYDKI